MLCARVWAWPDSIRAVGSRPVGNQWASALSIFPYIRFVTLASLSWSLWNVNRAQHAEQRERRWLFCPAARRQRACQQILPWMESHKNSDVPPWLSVAMSALQHAHGMWQDVTLWTRRSGCSDLTLSWALPPQIHPYRSYSDVQCLQRATGFDFVVFSLL